MENIERIVIDGIEVSDAGRLTEIHRNVTVEVIEHSDGSQSFGWKRQDNTISEYIIPEENEDG